MDPSSIAPVVSPWLSLCGLLLPSIVFTGVFIARRCIAHPGSRRVAALPLGLALWMLATHLIARATCSFVIGAAAGSLLVAIPGSFELVRLARRPGSLTSCFRAVWGRCRVERAIKVGAIALMAVPIFRDHFHDELTLAGHDFIVERMLMGHYPPAVPFFPSDEYRYHFGFDLLAALLGAIFRVGAPLAIDLLGVVLLLSILASMAQIGRIWLGARRGSWLALPGFFGGGITLFATPEYDTVAWRLSGFGTVELHWLGPPISSYFFQHPFALGMALGLAAYAVHVGKVRRDGLRRFVPLAIFVVGLPLAQVAIAAVFGCALLIAEAFDGERFSRRGAIGGALVLATLAALRPFLGGWFASAPGDSVGPSILPSLGPVDEPLESIVWLAQTFGLLLPLGFLGLAKLRRGRFAALLVIAAGLGLGSTVRYAYSWDMVKFIAIAQLMLALTTAFLLILGFQRAVELGRPRQRILVAVAGIVVLHAGIAFPVVTALVPDGPLARSRRVVASADWRSAIELLRERTSPEDIVYERSARHEMVNQFGLNVPHLGWVARALGYVGPRTVGREAFLAELPPQAARWREQGIFWFALEVDEPLAATAAAWLSSGEAELVARFGDVSVIRLVP